MKAIFKYTIELQDRQKISMPQDAKILSVQYQPVTESICMWAMVEMPSIIIEQRTFVIIGTGQNFNPEGMDYLATVQTEFSAGYVWHIFEIKK